MSKIGKAFIALQQWVSSDGKNLVVILVVVAALAFMIGLSVA